jgi:hypothetical protein
VSTTSDFGGVKSGEVDLVSEIEDLVYETEDLVSETEGGIELPERDWVRESISTSGKRIVYINEL